MKKSVRILFVLGIVLFVAGWLSQMIMTGLNTRDMSKDGGRMLITKEIKSSEYFADALIDADSDRMYVFFQEGSFVNTYDTDGKFLWAAAIPQEQNGMTRFMLSENRLYICHNDYTYIYDAKTGEFSEKIADDLIFDKTEDWENVCAFGGVGNTFEIEEMLREKSVHTGFWQNGYGFVLSLAGALLIGVSVLFDKFKKWKNAPKKDQDSLTKKVCRAYKISAAVCIAYAVCNVIFAVFFHGYLMIGLIPLSICFIIVNIVLNIRTITENDDNISFWRAVGIAAYLTAFFSVIIAAAVVG